MHFFRQRRGGKIDSLFCLAVPQDAGPSCTPPQWHHRLTFFLFLFLPPPASYANCNRTPLSRTGDVLMLGSFLSGGLWAPGQHLLCVCSPVASGLLVRTSCAFALRWSLGSWSAPPVHLQGGSQCWTRADLGSRKEAPRPHWGGCRPLRVARARPGSGCAQKAGG